MKISAHSIAKILAVISGNYHGVQSKGPAKVVQSGIRVTVPVRDVSGYTDMDSRGLEPMERRLTSFGRQRDDILELKLTSDINEPVASGTVLEYYLYSFNFLSNSVLILCIS